MNVPWLEVEVAMRRGMFSLDAGFSASRDSLVLFGPSGAGKSLLLSAVAGIERPDAGRIAFKGAPLFDSANRIDTPARKRRIGLTFQHHALFPHLTVRDNLRFGLRGAGRADPRIDETAAALGFAGLLDSWPGRLSGGEKQRVALGRALLAGPRALLLDEPFSSLDAPERERLRTGTLAFLRERGIPFVLVTHDLEEAYIMGEEIAVIDGGRILQAGGRDEVIMKPAGPAVAGLMAVRNFIETSLVEVDGDLARIRAGHATIDLPAVEVPAGRRQFTIGIRPENVRIVHPGRESDKPNVFSGEIVSHVFTGFQHQIALETKGMQGEKLILRAAIPDYPYKRMGLETGMTVRFYLPPRCINVISD